MEMQRRDGRKPGARLVWFYRFISGFIRSLVTRLPGKFLDSLLNLNAFRSGLFARSATGPRLAFRGQLAEVLRPALGDAGPALASRDCGGVEPRLADQIIHQGQR